LIDQEHNVGCYMTEMVKHSQLLLVGRKNVLFFAYCLISTIFTGPTPFTSHGRGAGVLLIDCTHDTQKI